jgi:predicted N-acetyltransferase YhbS
MKISCHRDQDLTQAQAREIIRLLHEVWPKAEQTLAQRLEAFLASITHSPAIRVLAWNQGQAIGHVKLFPRCLRSPNGEFEVMALAGVCVAFQHRGAGVGRELILRTFAEVVSSDIPVTLFQTAIPDFYCQFGAVTVPNEFYSSSNAQAPGATPWWDPWAMIYPANYPWPQGAIDLQGPAY